MANTTNLNLVKPAGTDYALVSVINGNMDIIDSKVGAIPANESAQSQITALNNQIAKRPEVNINNTYTENTGIVVVSVSASFTNGVASVSLESYRPAGKTYISMAFVTAKDTSTITITGAQVNISTSVLTIKSGNTSFTGSTDVSILAFYR